MSSLHCNAHKFIATSFFVDSNDLSGTLVERKPFEGHMKVLFICILYTSVANYFLLLNTCV